MYNITIYFMLASSIYCNSDGICFMKMTQQIKVYFHGIPNYAAVMMKNYDA